MDLEDRAKWCMRVINEAMDKGPAEIAVVAGSLNIILKKYYSKDFIFEEGKIKPSGTQLYKEQCEQVDEITREMTRQGFDSNYL